MLNILEKGGFTILVVNARHIKYVPGHKTDKKDSAWICKLLLAGETDPDYLASLCTHKRLKSTQAEIRDAVEGNFTEHHHRMLRIIRRNISNLEESITELEADIDVYMQPYNELIERIVEIPNEVAIV